MMRKFWNKYKNKLIYRTFAAAVIVSAMLAVFLPGSLLLWKSQEEMNRVEGVPVEYYSPEKLAVARNASANMGVYRKLQLITGRWESEESAADSSEWGMENYEAIELAREQVDALYQLGIYPVSLLSDYENWYSWEAECCQVVDATFHTYTAHYWKLSFVKYDGTERHCVYMLEDGTVFLAEAWMQNGVKADDIVRISDLKEEVFSGERQIILRRMEVGNQRIEDGLSFAECEITDLQWMDWSRLQVGEAEYDTLQLTSSQRYLYVLQPMK